MSPQHMDALALANRRRRARAAMRSRITESGGRSMDRRIPQMRGNAMLEAAHELQQRPECLWTMTVFDFLRWTCKPLEARTLLNRADIHNELRTVEELTGRQLQVLCDGLRDRAEWLGADVTGDEEKAA